MVRTTLVLVGLALACASSSAPIIVDHDETRLVVLPASAYPDDAGDTRIARLVARDDHALVVGMGACVGKAIDRCLAGAPLWVRGDEVPRQLDSLRSPTSLLWTELTSEGDVVVHRMPEAGEPSLTRFDATDAWSIDRELDSSPALSRAVDGSVLAEVRAGDGRVLLRLGAEGEDEIARGRWFAIEPHGETTHVQVHSDDRASVVLIEPNGELTRPIEDARSILALPVDGRRVYCAELDGRSELVEPATGARVELTGSCGGIRTREGLLWNEVEVWVWDDSPTVLDVAVSGTPRHARTTGGWVLVDDARLRWFDHEGVELRSEPIDERPALFARDGHVAIVWNDATDRARARIYGDATAVADDVALDGRLVDAWLADAGVLWVTTSSGVGDPHLPAPASEVYRVEGGSAAVALEGAVSVALRGSLLAANGTLFELDTDMGHVLEVDALRDVAPQVYELTVGAERVLVRWDEGELVELARATERFELTGTTLRWQHLGRWAIGRLVDGELVSVRRDLDDARRLAQDLVSITRDGRDELCDDSRCWTVPMDMSVVDAQVTDTGRMFAMLRDGDDDVLWYSLR